MTEYPKQIPDGQVSMLNKFLLRTRSQIPVPDDGRVVYLSRCIVHNIYYLDRLHTGKVTRCPKCDQVFLKKYGFVK